MENDSNTLDQGLLESQSQDVILTPASSGKRFINMIVDLIFIYILLFILGMTIGLIGKPELLDSKLFSYFIFYVASFLYYVPFEYVTGKTVGKMLTKTRVVNITGSKPSSNTIWTRTLCRIIPFEAFSFLGSRGGLHDRLSDTIVIDERPATS